MSKYGGFLENGSCILYSIFKAMLWRKQGEYYDAFLEKYIHGADE